MGWTERGHTHTHTHSSVLPFKCDEAQISTSDHYAEVRVKGYDECDMGSLVSRSLCVKVQTDPRPVPESRTTIGL